MEKIYKDRINALADLIEKQPHVNAFAKQGFCMDRWLHRCGTPSCIAGWACSLSGDLGVGVNEIWGKAEAYLGISEIDKNGDLFLPTIPGVDIDLITPVQAATTLRKLAETGKVDWSHVKGEL